MTIRSERSRIFQVVIELLIPKSSKVAVAMFLIMTFGDQVHADNTSSKKSAPTPSPPPKPPPSQTSSSGHSQPSQSIRPPPVFNVQPANNPFSLKSLFTFPSFSPKVNNTTAASTPMMSHPPVWTPSQYPPQLPVSTPNSPKASANGSPNAYPIAAGPLKPSIPRLIGSSSYYPATTPFKAPLVFGPPANNSLADTTQATIGIPTSKQNNYPTLPPPVIPHFPTSPPQNNQASTEDSYSPYATDEAPAGPIVPAYTATRVYPIAPVPAQPKLPQPDNLSGRYPTVSPIPVFQNISPSFNNNPARTPPAVEVYPATSSPALISSGTPISSNSKELVSPFYLSAPATKPSSNQRTQNPYAGMRTIYPLSPVPVGHVFTNIFGAQCTAYAATRFDEAAGIQEKQRDFIGNANTWYTKASNTWVTLGPSYPNPPPGSVAVYDDSVYNKGKQVWGGDGHVAVVEIDENEAIQFSEQNWSKNIKGAALTNMSSAQYQQRAGQTWSNMLAAGSIKDADYNAVVATGQQHEYRLVGFIVPVTLRQNQMQQ